MNKYLNSFTQEEFRQLLETNKEISSMIEENFIENEMHFISEQLDCFRGSLINWSIGFYQRNYIQVKDHLEFICDFKEYVYMFGSSETTETLLEQVLDFMDKNDVYEEAEKLEEYAEQLKDCLLDYFNKCTEIETDYLIDTALFMQENSYFDDMYILNKNYKTVYETINTVKEYN